MTETVLWTCWTRVDQLMVPASEALLDLLGNDEFFHLDATDSDMMMHFL